MIRRLRLPFYKRLNGSKQGEARGGLYDRQVRAMFQCLLLLPRHLTGEHYRDQGGRQRPPQGLQKLPISSFLIAHRKQDQVGLQALKRLGNTVAHCQHGNHIQVFRSKDIAQRSSHNGLVFNDRYREWFCLHVHYLIHFGCLTHLPPV